jgi:Kef-type K+ transport system membrane component KefB
MEPNHILFNLFLIFTGAAVVSTVVLVTRQSLLVAYILLGILLGPFGFKLIPDRELARQIGDIGIIFLLFLLGVELNPRDLWHMLGKISGIAITSSLAFFIVGTAVTYLFGFTLEECVIVGAAMMFSSTIIGLKLLPTAMLQHQRVGEIMVGILLFQDLIAILTMLLVHGLSTPGAYWLDFGISLITLPTLLLVAFVGERYVLRPLLSKFDKIHEYIFLVAIAWCIGMAKLAAHFGLLHEIGAFIAGVAIAEGPIASYITSSLRPIRDFCLVLFFFTIGAGFNLQLLPVVLVPAILLSVIFLLFKPFLFEFLLKRSGEVRHIAVEAGIRLGQASEFSLLLGLMAYKLIPDLIDAQTNYLIQAVTIITFVISCYWVGMKYPTPMSFDKKLQRD